MSLHSDSKDLGPSRTEVAFPETSVATSATSKDFLANPTSRGIIRLAHSRRE
jgi:hypothetical protein